MRYVILRDDDTNALTPVENLERLYRPFLDRGLPVNLSVIPDVAAGATTPALRRRRPGRHVGYDRQIHRQTAVQKRAVKPLQILNRRQRIGVVVAKNDVSHFLDRKSVV